ncbi:MAG: type II toxin-antitoxin system death-on-curing family toxin [Mycoplasma sp.]|nr:type II toxin-antitoxin system death-on-curing family toxin [Mycoplasma sp.]
MNRIIFFIVKNKDDPDHIFNIQNKNSLLSSDEKKFYFNSKYTGIEEIDVNFENIIFDETLYHNLELVLEIAKEEAKKLSEEPLGKEIIPGSLKGVLYSAVMNAYYNPPNSIFDFVTILFIKIATEHKLYNGNKRVALLFLIGSLRLFGYHFYFSKGFKKDYEKYETKLENIVKKYQNGYNKYDEEIKWVQENSVIALEWR